MLCGGGDKTPEPDGFGSKFFKDTWSITGADVIAGILEFFRTGELLKK